MDGVPQTLNHAAEGPGSAEAGGLPKVVLMIRSIVSCTTRLAAIVVLSCVVTILADPYIGFGSSFAAIAIDSVLPVLLALLLCAITGRAWVALLVEFLVLWVLRYADHAKMTYLASNLVYADLTVVGGFLKNPHLVVGFIHPTAAKIAGVSVVVVAFVALCIFARRRRLLRLPGLVDRCVRIACLGLAVAGMATVGVVRAPDIVESLGWEVFSQIHGAYAAGITGNLLLGGMTDKSVERRPDPAAVKAFWQEPAVRLARKGLEGAKSDLRPDIVIVQSESLFEPSQLCGFSDQPVLKHVAAQQPQGGSLHVPVFGGRTLQTEFEVQTGMPVDFYPGSMFAYYELVKYPFAALPQRLGEDGYRTLAIHPDNRGFWRRDAAMPDMGFDAFEDIGSFLYPRDYSDRGHVRDAALMRAVLAELDAASGPTYITAITMDNHFPYGAGAPSVDAGLGIPAALTSDERRQMADYLVHAIDADDAYGFLLDALKRRGRPTLVLFYGDHMPPLGSIYQTLCFKDGKRPEEHFPPFRVWANFPLPSIPASTYSYLLPGWLMHAAGLPLKGTMLANALAGEVANNPATSDAVRQRVLSEYANVAAMNVDRSVPLSPGRGQVFVGREHALKLLMGLSSQGGKGSAGVSPEYDDLYFPQPGAGEIDFALDGGVSSMSLRPYLGAPEQRCMKADANHAQADFSVEADGRLLYRAAVSAQTVRLATLDLQGVKHLTLRTTGSGSATVCSQLYVRVARMRCYSAKCTGPGEPANAAPASRSRILTGDPQASDIAALDSIIPESVRLMGMEKSAPGLSWLMAREVGHQNGYSPIETEAGDRLFIPPADDRDAWIDFDAGRIGEVTFSPHIDPLSPECIAKNEPGKEGGLVGLTFLLDGKPAMPRFIVDRNYKGDVTVNTGGARTLRIAVDKGNQVSWCDWFSVGVEKIKPTDSGNAPEDEPLPDVTASYRAIPPAADH